MSRTSHVTDELELYALGALPPADAARVAAHVAECPACGEQARALEDVALALPGTLPEREVPARLRSRILASARADLSPARARRGTARVAWLRPLAGGRIVAAGLALAIVLLVGVDVRVGQDLATMSAERAEYAAILEKVSHGGKTWYMAGLDRWAGSGGTLIAPAKGDLKPFVVFHDLRGIDSGAVYTIWLVDEAGHWARAANFVPDGESVQAVDLDTPIEGYTQCALTIETAREGGRRGPLVMQSRIAAPRTP